MSSCMISRGYISLQMKKQTKNKQMKHAHNFTYKLKLTIDVKWTSRPLICWGTSRSWNTPFLFLFIDILLSCSWLTLIVSVASNRPVKGNENIWNENKKKRPIAITFAIKTDRLDPGNWFSLDPVSDANNCFVHVSVVCVYVMCWPIDGLNNKENVQN